MTEISLLTGVHWRRGLIRRGSGTRYPSKADGSSAAAVILDLVGAVLPKRKASALATIAEAARLITRPGRDVRINRPLERAARDLEATIGPDAFGVMVAKATGGHFSRLAEGVEEREAAIDLSLGHPRLIPLAKSLMPSMRRRGNR